MQLVKRFIADERGTAAVELGLVLGLIVIGLISGVNGLGNSVSASYQDTATKIAASH